MFYYLGEKLQEFAGNRKTGVDCSASLFRDDGFLEQKAPKANLLKTSTDLDIGFENFYNQYQENTPHCVAFTIAHYLSFFLTLKYRRSITISGKYIAALLIDAEILTKTGARLDLATEFIARSKDIYDTERNRYKVDAPVSYSRQLIPEILSKGYPMIAGSVISSPMCTSDHFLKIGGLRGGHAYLLIPSRETEYYVFAENTWKNWGIPYKNKLKSGQFKIRIEDLRYLFAPIVFPNVTRTV